MNDLAYAYRDLPLTPSIAETIILGMIQRGEATLFRRDDLARQVRDRHLASGGIVGSANYIGTTKKALGNLKSRGLVENPGYGQWRAVHQEPVALSEVVVALPVPALPKRQLVVEGQIGTGDQFVYVYFYPNDRALAGHKDAGRWECKVGMSTSDPQQRVVDQVSQTSSHTLPTIGLIIATTDALALEQALHSILRFAGRQIRPTVGSEWFITSPDEIKRLYQHLLSLQDA